MLRTITLAMTTPGSPIVVPGEVHGALAITPAVTPVSLTGLFAVTHIPTGRRITPVLACVTHAREAVEHLREVDWNRPLRDLQNDPAVVEIARLTGQYLMFACPDTPAYLLTITNPITTS